MRINLFFFITNIVSPILPERENFFEQKKEAGVAYEDV